VDAVIFVKLLDEGVDVWRPVPAEQVSPGVFRIPADAAVPESERWEFRPGATVRCELRRLSGGKHLVAVEHA
jgi:hypothetical protein